MEKFENNSLSHIGILGMKWGRRKARDTSGSDGVSSGKGKEDAPDTSSEDHKKVSALRKKKASELSNADMQAVISRMQLEKQFSELNKKQVSAGQKFVTDLVVNSGKQLATAYVNDYMKKGAERLMASSKKMM